ncbi:MAG TPA: cupredoxin domain-containing protein [Candidatus Saccharimonadales bacterium]|nr:cupredoxin domain-containing protein [Candidatus Saccharimonadales bacterium]
MVASVAACAPATAAPVRLTIATAPGETLAFEPAETTVQAGGPIAITFRNGSSLTHNLVFTGVLTGATRTIVEPDASDEVHLAHPAPGVYPFACTIHEGMGGTLVVVD